MSLRSLFVTGSILYCQPFKIVLRRVSFRVGWVLGHEGLISPRYLGNYHLVGYSRVLLAYVRDYTSTKPRYKRVLLERRHV